VGNGVSAPEPDEIQADAPDAYKALSFKVNKMLDYSVRWNYDYTVLVDTDTFIDPRELDALPWGTFDYAGQWLSWEGGFAFGGPGLALSKKAAEIVVGTGVQDGMDDINIGDALRSYIANREITWYSSVWTRRVGWHFPKNVYAVKTYDPRFPWMQLMFEWHINGRELARYWNVPIGGQMRQTTIMLTREDREAM
jgi:hypothetical protein